MEMKQPPIPGSKIAYVCNKYKTKSMKRVISILLFATPFILHAQVKGIKHVILIGIDGLGANYLSNAKNVPTMQSMMKDGASTLHARCVMPSSSADNWASMTMGADPSLTGYTEWDSKVPEFPSRVTDQYGLFPSICGLLREQKPKATIGVIYSWSGIGYLFPKKAVNKDENTNNDSITLAHAQQYIKSEKPDFLFLHFDNVDGAGHNIGWGTPEYYRSISIFDNHVGGILAAVDEAGIRDNTIIILTSDHGGINKGHGGKTLQEMEIPWIIIGRKIKKGYALKQSIMTYDTAATIAYIFGLKTPQVWVGRPVLEAFE